MARLSMICVAGALGTAVRYGVALAAPKVLGAAFPYGTLIVNVGGSFILAVLMGLSLHSAAISPAVRLTLGTGFCGGLTTYSTFNYETLQLLQEKAWLVAATNVTVTLVSCMGAAFLGWMVAAAMVGK
jgi:CrcB protein